MVRMKTDWVQARRTHMCSQLYSRCAWLSWIYMLGHANMHVRCLCVSLHLCTHTHFAIRILPKHIHTAFVLDRYGESEYLFIECWSISLDGVTCAGYNTIHKIIIIIITEMNVRECKQIVVSFWWHCRCSDRSPPATSSRIDRDPHHCI